LKRNPQRTRLLKQEEEPSEDAAPKGRGTLRGHGSESRKRNPQRTQLLKEEEPSEDTAPKGRGTLRGHGS